MEMNTSFVQEVVIFYLFFNYLSVFYWIVLNLIQKSLKIQNVVIEAIGKF